MLYDFLIADSDENEPRYRQIYYSVRRHIEDGSLKKNTRLPSVRELCAELGISKTTVLAAYEQLSAEGYIYSLPKKGYFVAADFNSRPPESPSVNEASAQKSRQYYEYDFSGKSIDSGIVDLSHWRKCVKDVINRDYLLTSYGDPQGEEALRKALQQYAVGTRSVNSTPENIVIGAGTQPVLSILCALLGKELKIAVAGGAFVQSEFVFRSYGYEVEYFESDRFGARVDSLDRIKPDLVLINPNYCEESGESMPVTRRLELIRGAKLNNALIIEDDYNGELRYSTHPMPCVQHYDTENTVYLGSFSKVLLPSVRLSYMVLPRALTEKYREIKKFTNQTASKTEQLALAEYINSRKIDVHLRKARRVYLEKSRLMLKSIRKYFPDWEIKFNETSLYCTLKPPFQLDAEALSGALEENSIRIMARSAGKNELSLSFSGISSQKTEGGIEKLAKIIGDTA